MKNFFLNLNTNFPIFKAFNIFHIVSLALIFIIFIIIIYNKKNIEKIKNINKKRIRIVFGIVLTICYILRRGSFLYYGVYNWKNHLSLGFCNMNNILFIIYCFTGNKKVYNLCYYCTFCGPLLSILMPVINIGINNYSFINFIIIHHFIFLMNILFAIFENKKYNLKDMIKAYIYMITYMLCCYLFNNIFGTNYNLLKQFLTDELISIKSVSTIISNNLFNCVILLMVGLIMNLIGRYILKILNFNNE